MIFLTRIYMKDTDKFDLFYACFYCNGSEENKQKIIDCIGKIHSKLHSKKKDSVDGVQLSKLLELPWKIGFVRKKRLKG